MLTAQLIIARAANIGASVLFAGIFTFELVIFAPARRLGSGNFQHIERRLFRLATWSLVVALLSCVFWFWLEVASMSGLFFNNALSATEWRTVLFETRFGRVWQVRLALILVAFALIGLRSKEFKARSALIAILPLVSVVHLVLLACISHAAAARVQPLGLLGDALHLCAAGGWLGGLVPLTIFLAPSDDSFSASKSVVQALGRFSTLSLCCVSLLIATGISNSWLLVGSIHALFATVYGWLLVSKLTLFAVLIGFGARNRLAIKTNLVSAQTGSGLLPQLRRNVICEACLGALVVAIVACLGVTPPASHP